MRLRLLIQCLWIIGWMLGCRVIFAGGLLSVEARTGAQTMSASDQKATTLIVLSSQLDNGVAIRYEQFVSRRIGYYLTGEVVRRSFLQPNNIRYFVSNMDQQQITGRGGMDIYLSKRVMFGFEISVGQYLSISPLSVASSELVNGTWPGVGASAGCNLIRSNAFFTRITGRGHLLVPTSGSVTFPAAEIDGRLAMGFQIKRLEIEAYGYYSILTFTGASLSQTVLNAGIGAALRFSFGRVTDSDYHEGSYPPYLRNTKMH